MVTAAVLFPGQVTLAWVVGKHAKRQGKAMINREVSISETPHGQAVMVEDTPALKAETEMASTWGLLQQAKTGREVSISETQHGQAAIREEADEKTKWAFCSAGSVAGKCPLDTCVTAFRPELSLGSRIECHEMTENENSPLMNWDEGSLTSCKCEKSHEPDDEYLCWKNTCLHDFEACMGSDHGHMICDEASKESIAANKWAPMKLLCWCATDDDLPPYICDNDDCTRHFEKCLYGDESQNWRQMICQPASAWDILTYPPIDLVGKQNVCHCDSGEDRAEYLCDSATCSRHFLRFCVGSRKVKGNMICRDATEVDTTNTSLKLITDREPSGLTSEDKHHSKGRKSHRSSSGDSSKKKKQKKSKRKAA